MIRTFGLLVATALLVGCSSEPRETQPISHDEIAETLRKLANDGDFFRAGQWESTSRILDISGVSESEAAELKQRIGQQKFSTCLTPDEVTRPDADFFSGSQSDCAYSRFRMGEGKIEATMRCVTGAIVQDSDLVGTYSPERYDFTLTSKGDGPKGETMVMAIAARRVGDCKTLAPSRPAPTGENDNDQSD